nr:EOG090X07PD [Eulimnadia texana]
MRRRAMSHNPNRLPRRLREAHIAQREKSGGHAETKRPSRKYRRRPSRLAENYKERAKGNSWLETHIWHAKRNLYPRGAIGRVTFHWKPVVEGVLSRTVWIWTHPSFYPEVLEQLKDVFALTAGQDVDDLFTNGITGVEVRSLKNSLIRFRLRGPQSGSVLSIAYELHGVYRENNKFPPNSIRGIYIRDPRLTLPAKKCIPSSEVQSNADIPAVSTGQNNIDLWDRQLREAIQEKRKTLPDSEINKRRQQLLVPGSRLPAQLDEIQIPLLLVNSSLETKEESGWDVIGPAGWGTALWLPLVYSGGRVGGLLDAVNLNYEHGTCLETRLDPDTAAGKQYFREKEQELIENYFRRPPKNRLNYIKLGIPCPFRPNWEHLSCEFTSFSDYFILRDKSILKPMKESANLSEDIKNFLENNPCLVEITVLLGTGTAEDYSMICCPNPEDSGNVTEPQHKDETAKERNILKKQHKEELAKLTKKRKESKKEGKSVEDLRSSEICQQHSEAMKKLWLPKVKSIRDCCSRQVMGFVTSGGFSLKRGKGFGRGYVVGASLCQLQSRRVLVRNTNSLLFKWAILEVV